MELTALTAVLMVAAVVVGPTLQRDLGYAVLGALVVGAMPAAGLPGRCGGRLGWGLATLLGAEVRPGADLLMKMLGRDVALRSADLVITGEGKLDPQSAFGKGPVALARAAAERDVPTIGVAGVVEAVRTWSDGSRT